MPGLNVELLETSFALVAPRGEELVARFYDKLFEQYPAVEPMFAKTDRKKQEGALLAALSTVVAGVRSPEKLVPVLEKMGEAHRGYGAVSAHYDAVGGMLLETLAEFAGDAWSEELAEAWGNAYGVIAGAMQAGAEKAA
ncbi:MAG TPA: globin family protein [Dehalococcoidia bacterium]|nr:globin family protein [Dehalococcoidia bacterium]